MARNCTRTLNCPKSIELGFQVKYKSNQALLKLLRELDLARTIPDLSERVNQGEGMIHALAEMGVLDERATIQAIADKLGIAYLKLEDPAIQTQFRISDFIGKLEPEFCWKHTVIPLYRNGETIIVAFSDPTNYEVLKTAEFCLNSRITQVVAEDLKIKKLLAKYYPSSVVKFDLKQDDATSQSQVEILKSADPEEDLDWNNVESAPIVKLCNKVLSDGIAAEASDIHIDPGQHTMQVRFRVDGVLRPILEIPKKLQGHVTSRFKLLSGMDIAERRRPQDGRLRVKIGDMNCDMRVSSLLTTYGEKLVLRILRSETQLLTFPVLGMPGDTQARVEAILHSQSKMLLVTGPTGSGKTTTLYTCLNFLRDGKVNIQTVEDPIEYRIPGINQVQVNSSINVTFASALRSVLRQDPDVIMVGEIRDFETADIAVQAAQTGHLVLSTLHANSAPAAANRLINLGIDPYLLSTSIAGIIAQRLVRKLCTGCRKPASPEYLARHRELMERSHISPDRLMENAGCESCGGTGYRGRLGLYSFLEFTDQVSDLVMRRAPIGQIVSVARRSGYVDIRQSAIDAVASGTTTFDEVKAYLIGSENGEESTSTHQTEVKQVETARVPPALEATLPPPQAPAASRKAALSRPRILLIEDDPDIRSVLTHLLNKEMYDVSEATNGSEGLEMVYSVQPEVVLCDLMMPVMDGKQFLIKMRSSARTRDIPIIILTAVNTEENETSLLDLGANDFVSKTAAASVMLSRIRKALAN
jgi:type IV pilus assembly protein PilB